jgi:hypothetical protein
MAPTDRIRLPLRWQFVPVPEPADGSVRWTWRAYEQSGRLALQSAVAFETLSECIDDAKTRGYGG